MGKKKSDEAESTVYVAPVIEHSAWDEAPERVDLFTISTTDPATGEITEKTYDMPNKPHVGLALATLRMARIHGSEVAASWLLEKAVGVEGYDALTAEPELTPQVLEGIVLRVRTVVMGGLAAPKG